MFEMETWMVSGIARDDVEEKFDTADEDDLEDIRHILWDSHYDGQTQVCLVAENRNEAVRIAKKFYGFDELSIERCEA